MFASFMFTPADRLNENTLMHCADADLLVVDLEDSIHPSAKSNARCIVADFDFSAFKDKGLACGIRINTLSSMDGIEDIKLIAELYHQKKCDLAYIFIPKLNNHNEVKLYRQLFNELTPAPRIVSIIETCESIDDINGIAQYSDALILGQADLSAQMYTPNKHFLAFARAKLCIAAAKYNIPAIDTNSFELTDMDKLKEESLSAKNEGFMGKAVIHPKQVKTINDVFAINDEAIEKCRSSINSYNQANKGFVIENGDVIAPPFVAKAKKILEYVAGNNQESRTSR